MFRSLLLAGVSLFGLMATANAQDVPKFEAVLKAHAQQPGATFVEAPADAPAEFQMSGRFTSGTRVETLEEFKDAKTGIGMPFKGQALQGFSGIRSLGDGRFVVLTDNGFGAKANSADSLLMFNTLKVDWAGHTVARESGVFLSDPNRVVPFPIVNEATDTRYLTGADFDVESIQPVGDSYYFGDEFGPWLIKTDAKGVVTNVYKTQIGDLVYKGPDNQTVSTPNPGAELTGVVTQRSGGFEGMAQSPDGKTLYPLLEKTFWDADKKAFELIDGKPAIRMLQFDVATGAFADKVRYYPLEDAPNSIGDFNMIDDHRALVIERDQNQGDARDGWAAKPALLKRIYLIDIDQLDANGVVKKLGYIDLLDIKDPDGIAPRGSKDGVFTFPFDTIENVDRVDENTIVVANDNNFPFDVSREQGKQDDEEFMILDVTDLLKAK
ncbi:MAG: hypothetical protein JWP26_1229 [Devosia sp.]|uniref:esterase-like activity of phytase family protein n=1 Tax=Devosia sp. TaxID=1871048 RepID=UPI00262AC6D5|nr:esterase-like activity of phytase family protein [Devosia sp.]MDB5586259.1 hypothetical protein [Devosia sp.]